MTEDEAHILPAVAFFVDETTSELCATFRAPPGARSYTLDLDSRGDCSVATIRHTGRLRKRCDNWKLRSERWRVASDHIGPVVIDGARTLVEQDASLAQTESVGCSRVDIGPRGTVAIYFKAYLFGPTRLQNVSIRAARTGVNVDIGLGCEHGASGQKLLPGAFVTVVPWDDALAVDAVVSHGRWVPVQLQTKLPPDIPG